MIILGSTGSIGKNALYIAKKAKLRVDALSCGKNIELLNKQIKLFKPSFVCVQDKIDVEKVEHKRVFHSQEGIIKLIEESSSKLVLNALVGFSGLRASLHTQKLGKSLALANKESLVIAGKFLDTSKIIPIDSEHCALKALLKKNDEIKQLFITASGGAFYDLDLKNLKNVKAKDALKHPNWSMGAKITIDSATMMNKLFELLEGFHLFKTDKISAFIERHSLVHALCEFKDGGISAYLSHPDMKLSIASALLKEHKTSFIKELDLLSMNAIKFEEISLDKYPLFSLKNELLKNPDLGLVLNAANEVLVNKFLRAKLPFLAISKGIFEVLSAYNTVKISCEDELFELDREIRLFTEGL